MLGSDVHTMHLITTSAYSEGVSSWERREMKRNKDAFWCGDENMKTEEKGGGGERRNRKLLSWILKFIFTLQQHGMRMRDMNWGPEEREGVSATGKYVKNEHGGREDMDSGRLLTAREKQRRRGRIKEWEVKRTDKVIWGKKEGSSGIEPTRQVY